MVKDGYRELPTSYRVELRRTTVGSSVPTSVAKGSFLMYDSVAVDEQIHFAGISVETAIFEGSKVKPVLGIVVEVVYKAEVSCLTNEPVATLPEATAVSSLAKLVIVPVKALDVLPFHKAI